MRATFIYAAGDIRVADAPDPRLVEPTDALVQVTRACVCGSDLHPYHSAPATPSGTSIGHELIGVVTEVGSDVKTLATGDFVISPFAISCGVSSSARPVCRLRVSTAASGTTPTWAPAPTTSPPTTPTVPVTSMRPTVLQCEVSPAQLANSWIIMNPGGPPTPDKPDITVVNYEPGDTTSIFLNLRVADIDSCYREWSDRGATFLTPPIDRGGEIRCYMRDPDGYLIEVGQATGMLSGHLAAKRPEDLPG